MKLGFHWIGEDYGVRDGKVDALSEFRDPSKKRQWYTLLNQGAVAYKVYACHIYLEDQCCGYPVDA